MVELCLITGSSYHPHHPLPPGPLDVGKSTLQHCRNPKLFACGWGQEHSVNESSSHPPASQRSASGDLDRLGSTVGDLDAAPCCAPNHDLVGHVWRDNSETGETVFERQVCSPLVQDCTAKKCSDVAMILLKSPVDPFKTKVVVLPTASPVLHRCILTADCPQEAGAFSLSKIQCDYQISQCPWRMEIQRV